MRTATRLLLACLGSVLAFALPLGGCSVPPAQSDAPHTPRPFVGLAVEGLPDTAERLEHIAGEAGVRPAMVVVFLQWPSSPDQPDAGAFPRQSVQAIHDSGAVPCITWEPMYIDANGQEQAVDGAAILRGDWNAYIDRFAAAAAEWGHPLVLRPMHEPNLQRYHWGSTEEAYGPDSPALYRRMFAHIVQRFRAVGAPHVRFAFCPNAESVPGMATTGTAPWNTIGAYWPGAQYVDVLGLDGYNWGDTQTVAEHGWQSSFRSFADIFGSAHAELRAVANAHPDGTAPLPLVIFETASAASGGDRPAWAADAMDTLRNWDAAGVCWFQANKEVDWRLDPTTARVLREASDAAAIRHVVEQD